MFYTFASGFKIYRHEQIIININFWGALLLCPIHSRAKPYELLYGRVGTNQKNLPGSRSINHPLVVDLVDHTLTLPSQVVGYTLILESEEGEVFSYHIIGTVFIIPQDLKGTYNMTISDKDNMYKGMIFLLENDI